ncbi:alpha/beta fold hydrolase [Lysinimonas soli]|uniref:Alpha/beta fold hydrolase n=1 Tax=Lysinimonas soli TaxID=1074233 RepID=A0ABW0NK77_9MICO
MATADPAELDARVRSAEAALAARYGRTITEHQVRTTDGLRVRVVDYAGAHSGPPVLLLHGIASVTALAVPLIGRLEGRRVLAVDWPGHGLSGAAVLPRGGDLRAHAVAVLDAVIAGLDLTIVDVVGHSLGGQFAVYEALAHPERVRRLVLLGAPGAAFAEARPGLRMRLVAVPGLGTALLGLSTSQNTTRRGFARTLGAGALDGYPAEIIEIAHLCSQRPSFGPSVASLFRAMMTPLAARAGVAIGREELSALSAPTLLVWGDADSLLVPQRADADIAAIPHAELLEIHGGHAPWLNDLDRVGAAVSAHLN